MLYADMPLHGHVIVSQKAYMSMPDQQHDLTQAEPRARSHALSLVHSALAQARDGELRIVLLAGEPGIGKSWILRAAHAQARALGMSLLWGGASQAEGMPSFLPLIEALGREIRSTALVALRAQLGAGAHALASIFPELAAPVGEGADGLGAPVEQARLRLFEAIGDWLSALAAERGLLLTLDDLHWADIGTLDLIGHLARTRPDLRLALIGAYRSDPAEQPAHLTRAIAEMSRTRRLTLLQIERMDEPEIATLAANLLGAALDPAARSYLYAQSGGNPFFAEEIAQSWAERRQLQLNGGFWALVAQRPATSPSLAVALRERLARLTPETLQALAAAALIGRSFSLDLLSAALGLSLEQIDPHIRRAVAAQLLDQPEPLSASFRHDTIREALSADLSLSARRRLHRQIAEALGRQPGAGARSALIRQSYHLAQAGDHARALQSALTAADLAERAAALDDAASSLEAALGLLAPEDDQRMALLMRYAAAAQIAGREHAAIAALEQAVQLAVSRGAQHDAGLAQLRVAQAHWRLEQLPEAQASYQQAIQILERQPGPMLVEALAGLAELLVMSLHRHAEGFATAQRAIDLAREIEEPQPLLAATRTLGNLLVRANQLQQGAALLREALAIAEAAADAGAAAECCIQLSHALAWGAAFDQMPSITDRLIAHAQRSGDRYLLRHIHTLLAKQATLEGRWGAAAAHLDQAAQLLQQIASPEPLAFLQLIRGQLHLAQGSPAEALRELSSAIATYRAIGPGALVWFLGWQGLAHQACGDYDAAQRVAHELELLVAQIPAGIIAAGDPLIHLALMAAGARSRSQAARLMPRLAPYQGQWHDFLVDRAAAELAILLDDTSAASAHLASAAVAAQRCGFRPEIERISALRQQISAPRRAGYPAGLSAREVEVLRLVAAGQSNRAIAQALALSEKTIANHLTNIMGKIGVENRAAAAAFALRNGLAD